jgi:3-hydroxyisobutyrate dehydrogenase
MERIGFAGLGRMGQAMAGRLLAAGFPLALHNRTRAKADALLNQGAAWAETLADLTSQSDIIFTILTDDRAVEQVYSGTEGLLAGECDGKLVVEMSTIRTSTILALGPQIAACRAQLLDAPVSGTLEPARQGQLLAMVGGTEEDLERARPALEVLCRRIVHLGPSGSGTTMKLALNMPMAIFWAGLAEAMAIGSQFGLDTAQMLDVYLDSPVALPALRAKAPLLLNPDAGRGGAAHEVAFDVTGVRKDLLAMVATGQDVGVPTASGAAALAMFAAATAAGYGQRDLSAVVEYMAEVAKKTF